MTDHYTEANRLISATDTRDWNEPSPYVDRRIAAAQVHAVLALAEQQRIANLIALASALPVLEESTDGPETAAREAAYSLIEYKQLDPDDELPVISAEIARALRIETP